MLIRPAHSILRIFNSFGHWWGQLGRYGYRWDRGTVLTPTSESNIALISKKCSTDPSGTCSRLIYMMNELSCSESYKMWRWSIWIMIRSRTLGGVVPEEDILVSIYSDVATAVTARTVLEDNASGKEKESVLNDGLPDCNWKKGNMMSKSWRDCVAVAEYSSVPTLSLIPSCFLTGRSHLTLILQYILY